MSNLVVVAIPSDNDYVWQVSSDKVPHLTLLSLGDVTDSAAIQRMTDYVEHASTTSLQPLWLRVSSRGLLGSEDADVLFFDQQDPCLQRLRDFRSFLLTNREISAAYNSSPQFPEWTPHLTLGFPATPAKLDAHAAGIPSWIDFDRIALWTGDFEGPTFQLPTSATQWSADMSSRMNDVLAHHGVKGMRWGVRKGTSSSSTPPSEDSMRARATATEIKKAGGTHAISNKDLEHLLNRVNLEQRHSKMVEDAGLINRGNKEIKKFLETGKTLKELDNFLGHPVKRSIAKAIGKGIAKVTVQAAGAAARTATGH